jgi:hypothetical protein
MHFIDPEGPIGPLRSELIRVVEEVDAKLGSQSLDIIRRLRTDDAYVRAAAQRIVEAALDHGIRVG